LGEEVEWRGNSDLSMSSTEYSKKHRDFLVPQVGVFYLSSWAYQSVGRGRTGTFSSAQLTSV